MVSFVKEDVRNGTIAVVRGGLSEGELCQLGSSDEEWRCEKCAKEFEEILKRIEEAENDRRADEMVSEDRY